MLSLVPAAGLHKLIMKRCGVRGLGCHVERFQINYTITDWDLMSGIRSFAPPASRLKNLIRQSLLSDT